MGSLLVDGLLTNGFTLWNHPEGPKAIITVFRQCLPLCSKGITATNEAANENAGNVLNVLKASL